MFLGALGAAGKRLRVGAGVLTPIPVGLDSLTETLPKRFSVYARRLHARLLHRRNSRRSPQVLAPTSQSPRAEQPLTYICARSMYRPQRWRCARRAPRNRRGLGRPLTALRFARRRSTVGPSAHTARRPLGRLRIGRAGAASFSAHFGDLFSKAAVAGEHGPADAGQLVRQRHQTTFLCCRASRSRSQRPIGVSRSASFGRTARAPWTRFFRR